MIFIDWPLWEAGIRAPFNIHWDWTRAQDFGIICPGKREEEGGGERGRREGGGREEGGVREGREERGDAY
jgi:hypothetical protein